MFRSSIKMSKVSKCLTGNRHVYKLFVRLTLAIIGTAICLKKTNLPYGKSPIRLEFIPNGFGDPRVTRTGFRPDLCTGTVFAGPGTGRPKDTRVYPCPSLPALPHGEGNRLCIKLQTLPQEDRFDPDSVDSSLDVSIDNSDNFVRDRCDRVGAEEVGEGDMEGCVTQESQHVAQRTVHKTVFIKPSQVSGSTRKRSWSQGCGGGGSAVHPQAHLAFGIYFCVGPRV
ncbi:hypothetical protein K438DRAFT_1781564 [Mycena galopus ATCC 62051]|nr:hypothetical protein K438DRAFT_1781564 [Mycena galopus ATCC 62051]